MISIFEPKIPDESRRLLKDVFDKNWLGRGEPVALFEKTLSQFLKVDQGKIHTLGSCTDALFGAPKIFELPPGGEVILAANSFVGIGSAIIDAGFKPVIVDIDEHSGNISNSAVEAALSGDTAAIFVMDYGGIPVDVGAIRSLVGPDVRIFHDCATSLGTFVNGRASGTLADFACWSFDPMKLITSGEGGAIYVSDPERLRMAKSFFFHGLASDEQTGDERMKKNPAWWTHQLSCHGRRSIFSNINAAIALPQLLEIGNYLSRRACIRAEYEEAIRPLASLSFIRQDDPGTAYSNYFFTIMTHRRDELAFFLKQNGVYSTFKYFPLHKIDLFRPHVRPCPVTDKFSDMALNIPVHQYLSDGDVEKIVRLLRDFDSH